MMRSIQLVVQLRYMRKDTVSESLLHAVSRLSGIGPRRRSFLSSVEMLNHPGRGRVLPFLPGWTYSNPRTRFPKSHYFEFKVGVGRNLASMQTQVDPLDRVVTTTSRKTVTSAGFPPFQDDVVKQDKFLPSFVELDGKALRFVAHIMDHVPESLNDPIRKREFTIQYFLVDDSIQIVEQKTGNSGYVQGVFMRRHRVPRQVGVSTGDDSDFVSFRDFADTLQVVIYGRIFQLTGCNQFTEHFFQANGMKLQVSALQGITLSVDDFRPWATVPSKRDNNSNRPQFDTALLKPNQRAGYRRERFLKYNGKVLRFYAYWDDRKSMFGDKRFYIVNYYLAEDKVEVLESYEANEGRDPFPKLLRKCKLPKKFGGINDLGITPDDISDRAYVRDVDLLVGSYIEVYGRSLLLYDCDGFTRNFYRHVYKMEQKENCLQPDELIEFPKLEEPPYTGMGDEMDSIAAFYTLAPRTVKNNGLKQEELTNVVFRWKAKFNIQEMEHAGPDDSKRRFIVSYYLVDSTLAVYEPPVINSGFLGGKFLERQRVKKHGTTKNESQYLTAQDMLIDLPGTIWVNGYPFTLLECDRFTLRYLNRGNIASMLSMDDIHLKLSGALRPRLEELAAEFRQHDAEGAGEVFIDSFVQILDRYDTGLDEDELLALVQHWDKRRDGTVRQQDFLDVVAAIP